MSRLLRSEEKELVRLIAHTHPQLMATLNGAVVEDMDDGGMGSVQVTASPYAEPRHAVALGQIEFADEDGVVISVQINADQHGNLYEIDIWKTDFSPLRRYPRAEYEVT